MAGLWASFVDVWGCFAEGGGGYPKVAANWSGNEWQAIRRYLPSVCNTYTAPAHHRHRHGHEHGYRHGYRAVTETDTHTDTETDTDTDIDIDLDIVSLRNTVAKY